MLKKDDPCYACVCVGIWIFADASVVKFSPEAFSDPSRYLNVPETLSTVRSYLGFLDGNGPNGYFKVAYTSQGNVETLSNMVSDWIRIPGHLVLPTTNLYMQQSYLLTKRIPWSAECFAFWMKKKDMTWICSCLHVTAFSDNRSLRHYCFFMKCSHTDKAETLGQWRLVCLSSSMPGRFVCLCHCFLAVWPHVSWLLFKVKKKITDGILQ